MRPTRLAFLALLLPGLLLMSFVLNLFMIQPVDAQVNTPIPYTPGTPVITVTPTFPPNQCYPAFKMKPGNEIFVLPGVNIRYTPSRSAALVWNTIYENRDEDGNVVAEPKAVPVVIIEGPVCAEGFNWWKVSGTGEPGWVAEGRPDETGYFIIVPEFARNAPCSSLYNLGVGRPVNLLFNVRIRQAPSLSAWTQVVVPYNNPIEIAAGPQCVEGLQWWFVRSTVLGVRYEGWMAEGENEQQYIEALDLPSEEKGNLCSYPLPLKPGQRGFIYYYDGKPKSLRTAPGESSTLLFTLVHGVPFIVEEGGPVCANNMNWWKVRVLASTPVVGWVSEGSTFAGYWLATIDPNEFAR
jgi:hypothetical protein